MEDNHFIHRDIAARNCLLTNKIKMPSAGCSPTGQLEHERNFDVANYANGFNNSGIVVKIADFGKILTQKWISQN